MKNIYYADDDPDDREMFAEIFYEMFPLAGLRLFESGTALMQSLYMPRDPLPGLIVLDLHMSLKDGFECLKEIRSLAEELKDMKVIAFSTSGNPRMVEHVFGLGADFYAVKPVSYSGFKSLMNKIMEIDRDTPMRSVISP